MRLIAHRFMHMCDDQVDFAFTPSDLAIHDHETVVAREGLGASHL